MKSLNVRMMFRTTAGMAGAAVLCGALFACGYYNEYTVYEPVTRSLADVRASVRAVAAIADIPAVEPTKLGKIALSVDRRFLFVVEKNIGVRVADLADPALPIWIGYIEIPGCVDLAYLELGANATPYLFADSFVDLVVLRLILPSAAGQTVGAEEVARTENAFPKQPYQVFIDDPIMPWFSTAIPDDQVVVGFIETTKSQWAPYGLVYDMAVSAEAGGANKVSGSAGAVGSLARFALYSADLPSAVSTSGWYLYAVDDNDLRIFGIGHNTNPVGLYPVAEKSIGWGIETVFPYKDSLFVGSSSAMYVYDLASDPTSPIQLSVIAHVTARDPVVVGPVGPGQRDTAFVTLSENNWGFGDNLLIAIDVSNPAAPVELLRKAMTGPRGLGLYDANTLFVCEGTNGLKALSVARLYETLVGSAGYIPDGQRISYLDLVYDGFETYDLIPGPVAQIVVGPNGFRLYDWEPGNGSTISAGLTKLGELAAAGK